MKVNAMSFAKLCALMIDGELNRYQLAEATGLHYTTVLDYTRALHKEEAIHVVRWDDDAQGRNAIPVFKLGPGKDAPRRKAYTMAQRRARVVAKKKQIAKLHAFAGRLDNAQV